MGIYRSHGFLKKSRRLRSEVALPGLGGSTAEERATTCRVPHFDWGHKRLSADFCRFDSNELDIRSRGAEMKPVRG